MKYDWHFKTNTCMYAEKFVTEHVCSRRKDARELMRNHKKHYPLIPAKIVKQPRSES